ncbi:MAG: nuclear transport factor 2 family protein [Acidobacteriota bacterium]
MTPFSSAAFLAVLLATPPAEPAPAVPELAVASLVEELRLGELMLDADAVGIRLAHSFTLVEDDARISGAFAFLEPMRQLRSRKGAVRESVIEDLVVRVYGASAVASYRFTKVWNDQGTRHRRQGWSSDVFERRDDGEWILVHRHRGK